MDRAKAVKELKETFDVLNADVEEVKRRAGASLSEFDVRSMIRTFSALMEGLLYQMRQVAINSDDQKIIYSFEELMILKEFTCSLDDKGEVKIGESYGRALPMLLFTFKQFPKVHGAQFSPDTSVNGWANMRKLIQIRNQITHPKNKKDLQLTQKEWEEVNLGIQWFNDTVKAMFKACDKADEKFLQLKKTIT